MCIRDSFKALALLGLLVPGVALAQFSDSYNFLKAVKDRDGNKTTEIKMCIRDRSPSAWFAPTESVPPTEKDPALATSVAVVALAASDAVIVSAPETSETDAGTEIVTTAPVVPPMVKPAAVVAPEQTRPEPHVRAPPDEIATVDAAAPVTIVPNWRSDVFASVIWRRILARAVAFAVAALAAVAPRLSAANVATATAALSF